MFNKKDYLFFTALVLGLASYLTILFLMLDSIASAGKYIATMLGG